MRIFPAAASTTLVELTAPPPSGPLEVKVTLGAIVMEVSTSGRFVEVSKVGSTGGSELMVTVVVLVSVGSHSSVSVSVMVVVLVLVL